MERILHDYDEFFNYCEVKLIYWMSESREIAAQL